MEEIRRLITSSYDPPGAIKAFNAVPRFGHTSDIASFYQNGEIVTDNLVDYLQGTLFVGGFCLTAFLIWIIAMIVGLLRSKKAGIFGGFPFEQTTKEEPDRHRYWRIFMICSSVSIVVSGLVFLIAGARSAENVFEDVNDGVDGLTTIADKIVKATDDVILLSEDTVPVRDSLVTQLDSGICNTGANQDFANTVNSSTQTVIEVLTVIQDFSQSELTDLRDTFEVEFNSVTDEISGVNGRVEKWAKPYMVAVPVFLFGFILSVGSYMAWKGPFVDMYFKVQKWGILPLFSLVVILMAFVISITGTVLVINSDVCLGGESRSPEGFLEDVLTNFNLDENTMEATNYYIIDGCEGDYSKKAEVTDLITSLREGLDGISDLRTTITSNSTLMIDVCGQSEQKLDELKASFDDCYDAFDSLVDLCEKNLDILDCKPINDVFVDFYHDALCTSGPYAYMWIFATMMNVFVLGMVMILFRGALYPSIVNYDPSSEEKALENDNESAESAAVGVYDSSGHSINTDTQGSGSAHEDVFTDNEGGPESIRSVADSATDNDSANNGAVEDNNAML